MLMLSFVFQSFMLSVIIQRFVRIYVVLLIVIYCMLSVAIMYHIRSVIMLSVIMLNVAASHQICFDFNPFYAISFLPRNSQVSRLNGIVKIHRKCKTKDGKCKCFKMITLSICLSIHPSVNLSVCLS